MELEHTAINANEWLSLDSLVSAVSPNDTPPPHSSQVASEEVKYLKARVTLELT